MSRTTHRYLTTAIALLMVLVLVVLLISAGGFSFLRREAEPATPGRSRPDATDGPAGVTPSPPATQPLGDGTALLPPVSPAPSPDRAAGDAVSFTAFEPDGRRLLVARTSGVTEFMDVSGGPRQRIELKLPMPRAVALSPRGGRIAIANAQALEVWHTISSTRTALPANDVTALAIAADGSSLVSGHAAGAVRVWDTATWTMRTTLSPGVGPVTRLALAPDRQHVAVAGSGVAICPLVGGAARATIAGREPVTALDFAPDGLTLATAGPGGLALWDTVLWQKRAAPSVAGAVTQVAFWSGGRVLAAADAQGVIRTFDLATRQPLTTLGGANGPLVSMSLSHDGHTVAGADAKGVIVWTLSTRQPRRLP